MAEDFERLVGVLKGLPGVGYRSAQRMALHLLLEKPADLPALVDSLTTAQENICACERCGNMATDSLCDVCASPKRDAATICVVERVPDLMALERAGGYNGLYHVLGGKLSPINGVGPNQLNIASLRKRIEQESTTELILAIANDIEGEATCHYIAEELSGLEPLKISRIAFGLPSGGSIPFSDQLTLKNALAGRSSLAMELNA